MKCVIDGQNAAILAKAIHSFARIGPELFMETTATGLTLQTMNVTKTSFASISFNSDFFKSFTTKSASDPNENQCKLALKSCLGVFRNMKQVELCKIKLDVKECKLIVQFKCRLETVKTHHITILEHETLQAAYTTDNVPNLLVGNQKLFHTIVSNFKLNEEELSIRATEHNIIAQNYVEGSYVDQRFVRSQVTLKPEEFENYKISEGTTITFCMRELRAILNFAESQNISVTAKFETTGKPVVFVIKNFNTFEANLVMSTLSPEEESVLMQPQQPDETNRSVQLPNISHSESILADVEMPSIATATDGNASAAEISIQRKRNRIISQTAANPISSSMLQVINENTDGCDILRKKRKTTDRRASDILPSPALDRRTSEKPAPPLCDLLSENINVVFQDDSHSSGLFANDIDDDLILAAAAAAAASDAQTNAARNRAAKHVRDHRPIVRHVFNRCFTGSSQQSDNLGAIVVECSDEE